MTWRVARRAEAPPLAPWPCTMSALLSCTRREMSATAAASLTSMCRPMGRRMRPSASRGVMAAKASSARLLPVVESATMPTRWPRASWQVARSITWRNRPPTGARRTWRILSERSDAAGIVLEPALGDQDGVAGAEREGGRDLAAVHLAVGRAADLDLLALGARREAAGNGDRGL